MAEVKYPEHLLKKYPREFLSRVAKKLSYKRWGGYATALLDFCRKPFTGCTRKEKRCRSITRACATRRGTGQGS